MKMKRAQGFTLIELLLAVVVFAMVALFATVTLASTVSLQVAAKQSQRVSVQSARILDEMRTDIERSTKVRNNDGAFSSSPDMTVNKNALQILTLSSGNPITSQALVMTVPVLNTGTGQATSQLERRIYCADTAGILVRFIVPAIDRPSTPLTACTGAKVNAAYPQTGTNPVPVIMAESTFKVSSLRFWPVWGTSTVNGDQKIDPPAVRIELSAIFDNGGEKRASDKINPIVSRLLVNRNPLLDVTP
jgi:prepilin-type N-terminal cleavage/methylation domain-containing protein